MPGNQVFGQPGGVKINIDDSLFGNAAIIALFFYLRRGIISFLEYSTC